MDGSTALGVTALSANAATGSGQATYTTSTLSCAAHRITAVYGGDTNYGGNTSNVLMQRIVPSATLSIPTTFSSRWDATITVPINLSQSDGLDSADLAISYDTSRLEVLIGKRRPARYADRQPRKR